MNNKLLKYKSSKFSVQESSDDKYERQMKQRSEKPTKKGQILLYKLWNMG